ncbi:ricin-type beta-trefoil lectin domain-containing protein [Cordyceps javanica]|uniref:Ricin-type beta-trefoil lectin domain-containing protein n=1 Tax=Cordyceps javanica TaxID=43265 RepID=A0A545UQR1_9HYPO|nr:ricin-type beta-trefoil lectin domain-containing protein [Cordyceps javanica]TQW03751.1 ricin-type beta-trefoil lectin domain-containing protein [Cordyceps javanica]
MVHAVYTALLTAILAAGNPVLPRAVDKLNDAAFKAAQQRDDAATRALADVQIKAADGRCLFVDALSGDSRANLTPLQIAECGSRPGGQGFDVITKGKHNDRQGRALVVSTLTQACLSFDPRRPADSQVHLFSCGGRADGGGEVSDSQLFAFDGGRGVTALTPQNSPDKCLVVAGNRVVVGDCNDKDDKQMFTFGGDAKSGNMKGNTTRSIAAPNSTAVQEVTSASITATSAPELSRPVNTSVPAPLRSSAAGDQDLECSSRKVVTVTNTVTVTMPPPNSIGRTTSVFSGTNSPIETSPPGKKVSNDDSNSDCDSDSRSSNSNVGSSNSSNDGNGSTQNNGSKANDGSSNIDECNSGSVSATSSRNATATTTHGNNKIGGCDISSSATNTQTAVATTVRGSNSIGGCDQNGRNATATTTTRYPNGQHKANPTSEVPVSRAAAGAKLNPTAAAAANRFDTTARRALESVNLRAPDGRCLAIDPTAGDSRQNLIPVGLAACSEDPQQKFDVVTRGQHDDGKDGKALLVSVLTNGCLSFDNRRQQGDTVTIFSCGEGQTAASQLFPFDGSNNIVLQPGSDGGNFCLVAGKDRLGSASCDNQKDQVFELVEVLQSTADELLRGGF